MPVGVALLLEYLAAVLVVGWLWLRHGQRPRRLTVIGAVAAGGGVGVGLDLTGTGPGGPGRGVGGGPGGAGAAELLPARGGTEAGAAGARPIGRGRAWCAAALAALGWIGVLPVTATTGSVDFAGHRVSWVVPVLGLSLVAAAFAYVAGIGAARRLGAKLASFVGMGEVLFAILFAWLLLGQ